MDSFSIPPPYILLPETPKQDPHDSILDAAARLLTRCGSRKMTMSGLAEEAGIGVGTTDRPFGSSTVPAGTRNTDHPIPASRKQSHGKFEDVWETADALLGATEAFLPRNLRLENLEPPERVDRIVRLLLHAMTCHKSEA